MTSKLVTSLLRLVLISMLAVLLFFPERLKISFSYPFHGLFDNAYIRFAKGVVLFLFLYDLLRIFYYNIVKNPKAPKWLINVATLFVPLLVLLVFLEMVFMTISQSHEGNSTLASKIWFERYWSPVNEKGYRDEDHADSLGKTKVMVIGDSFAAGHGIKNVEDRFSNVLAQKLGDKYEVYNLGVSGSDTRDEYERFEKYGVKPDWMVLQYFPNDIEKAARDGGVVPQGFEPYSDVPGPTRPLFARSYLLNYIYWQLPHGNFAPYQDYAKRVYTDTTILNSHIRDLSRFVDYSKKNNVRLFVVIFPFSHNFEKTKMYTQPVETYFAQQQVPILEVSSVTKDLDPKDRIVGRNDAHASPLVNQRVGDALYKMLSANATAKADTMR